MPDLEKAVHDQHNLGTRGHEKSHIVFGGGSERDRRVEASIGDSQLPEI